MLSEYHRAVERRRVQIAANAKALLPEHYYGVDLGQSQDYTALTVLKTLALKQDLTEIPRNKRVLIVSHIDRFPLRVSYPAAVKRVEKYYRQDTSRSSEQYLVIDRAGVGAAPLDMFEEAGLEPWGICSTAGLNITPGDGERKLNVPKRDLVSAAQVAMQTGHLQIAKTLRYARVLRDELENFVVKYTPLGHDAYEAIKSGDHDDLVISLCLCVWAATTEHVQHHRSGRGTIWINRQTGEQGYFDGWRGRDGVIY